MIGMEYSGRNSSVKKNREVPNTQCILWSRVRFPDGIRLSSSSSLEHVLQMKTFRLRINDVLYDVTVEKPYGKEMNSDEGYANFF